MKIFIIFRLLFSGVLIIWNVSAKSRKIEVELAYYKSPPHFQVDPNNQLVGPLHDYLTQIIAPKMNVKFHFRANISQWEIKEVARNPEIDIVLGIPRDKSFLKIYDFHQKPFYLSQGIIVVKNHYQNKMPQNWILGHYPSKKSEVLPFIKNIAPEVFFLSPHDWINRGFKMLDSERIHGLLSLDKFSVSQVNQKYKNKSLFSCIDLPLDPIPLYLGFNIKSKKSKELLKRYQSIQSHLKISYNQFLQNYFKKNKIEIMNCQNGIKFLSKKIK